MTDLSHNTSSSEKYLTFFVDQTCYGLPVSKVREIIQTCPMTSVPHMPSYVKGVINLRGKIVPVIDMRERFLLPQCDTQKRTCIIVAQIETELNLHQLMGLIVDSVEDVSYFSENEIDTPPDFGVAQKNQFITGIKKTEKGFKALFDIDSFIRLDSQIHLSKDDIAATTHTP
jgi:purine-binding chemotaxis protein CheW